LQYDCSYSIFPDFNGIRLSLGAKCSWIMKQLAVAMVVHSERRNALGNPKMSRCVIRPEQRSEQRSEQRAQRVGPWIAMDEDSTSFGL
jgi:hypothetical protein